jgi:hypothetical protein
MSRDCSPDGPFLLSFALRFAALAGLGYAAIRIIQSIYDDVEFELGGLPNFQGKH